MNDKPALVIGIGEYGLLDVGRIVTYSLGSCVAIVLHDRARRIGAMAHCALPEPFQLTTEGRPGYFVRSAVPLLLEAFTRRGGVLRDSTVWLAGGASVLSCLDSFGVGPRNLAAAHDVLAGAGLSIVCEDTGGTASRTIDLEVESGEVCCANPTLGRWQLRIPRAAA